ncbi:hypothetical protein ACFSTC_49785 [Nonomuraea ferruginea]
MAAFLAALGFFLMSLVRLAQPEIAADIVIVVFTLFLVSWMIVPLLAFGLDDTLDPARLALFPLPTARLAVGMFTASATGVWPTATLIVTAERAGRAGLRRRRVPDRRAEPCCCSSRSAWSPPGW